jgi:hypothetical protein
VETLEIDKEFSEYQLRRKFRESRDWQNTYAPYISFKCKQKTSNNCGSYHNLLWLSYKCLAITN